MRSRATVSRAVAIHRVKQLDLNLKPWIWPYAVARRRAIKAHFARKQHEKPQLWNGRLLLARKPVFTRDIFSAQYFETDFASFLAWRDWGFPGTTVFNGFGVGAVRSSDGVFVLGQMAAHTANAGRVYFPAGTPDLDDVSAGRVDLAASVARELAEETGLHESDYCAAHSWHCVVAGSAIAIVRILDFDIPADALKARIEANLARQPSPELSAIHLVRDRRDFTDSMPRYVTAFIDHAVTTGL